jgi:hypothetical protein
MKLREFILLVLLGFTLAAKSGGNGGDQAAVAPDAHADTSASTPTASSSAGQDSSTGSNTLSIAGWYVSIIFIQSIVNS